LIHYRSFQNWDPPALAEIWRSQPPLRGRLQSITPSLLEELVFAKPYFDRHGLIVAADGARPVGFVHAAVGASEDESSLSSDQGTICQLIVAPHPRKGEIEAELLTAGENYLHRKGVRQIFGGCRFPVNPYYLGLYGSSELPGVLASDTAMSNLLRAYGYREGSRRLLWSRPLDRFKPQLSGKLVQLRLTHRVSSVHVLPDTWWDACVWVHADWTRYELRRKNGDDVLISATFWDLLPLGRDWGVHAKGLVRIDDTEEARAEGLTLLLISESLINLQKQGVTLFEAQAAANDESLLALFQQLGLTEYDAGVMFEKGKG
jgi:ribosomal protein S18 acetylase RimI-like enzyme